MTQDRTEKFWVLQVDGIPHPQPRPAIVRKTGRVYYPDKAGRMKAWKRAIMSATRVGDVIEGPLVMVIHFRLGRLKGHTTPSGVLTAKGRRATYPAGCDLDNLAKAVMDACVARGDMTDDRQVVDLRVTKAWADESGPGCSVMVSSPASG